MKNDFLQFLYNQENDRKKREWIVWYKVDMTLRNKKKNSGVKIYFKTVLYNIMITKWYSNSLIVPLIPLV